MKKPLLVSVVTMLTLILIGCHGSQEAPTFLTCGQQCHCWVKEKHTILKEYRVICNETGSQPVTLTEKVFGNETKSDVHKTYIRVEDREQVILTEGFINRWKQHSSCSLDLWRIKRLVLPQVTPLPPASGTWHHLFAGIGIVDSTLDQMPSGLFSGKQQAGLRLTRTSVGVFQPRLFQNVKILRYLHVEGSHIGIIQGSPGTDKLQVQMNKNQSPVLFQNSVMGQIETEALLLKSNNQAEMHLENVTIGQIETGGIILSNIKLVVNDSKVADLQREALQIHGSGSITITSSHLIAQPEALTHLPCSFYQHHIYSNDIIVSSPIHAKLEPQYGNLDNNEKERNSTSDAPKQPSLLVLASEKLKMVLHTSCIENNLPPWVLDHNCQTVKITHAETSKRPMILHAGLYSFVVISAVALVIVVILACLLANIRQRRPRRTTNSPVVIMSELPQDPIYEEPSTLMLSPSPPPVPPPVSPSCKTYNCDSNQRYSNTCNANGCSGETSNPRKLENHYTLMK